MATGTDHSVNPLSQLTTLASFTVTNPGQYFVGNLSNSAIQVVFGTAGNQTIMLLASGGANGAQGGDTNPPIAFYSGPISVCGPTGAQFVARHH